MSAPAPKATGRRVLITSAAVGAPLIGLAIAAVAVIPTLTTNPVVNPDAPVTTEVSALGATVIEGVTFNDTHWVVPVDTDWETFPVTPWTFDDYNGCSDEQRDWLQDHGEQKVEPALFTFTNNATAGENLSVNNIRLVGEQEKTPPSIQVECDLTGGGQGGVPMVVSDLTVGADVSAVISSQTDAISGSDVEYIPGEQVVFNLRPGDSSLLFLYLTEAADRSTFRGDIVATVTDGEDEQDVPLPRIWGGDELVIPMETVDEFAVFVSEGRPHCGPVDAQGRLDSGDPECDGAEIARQLTNVSVGGSSGLDVQTLTGTWSGAIVGDRHPYSLTVTLTNSGGRLHGDASYPEIPCTATWEQTAVGDDQVTLIETVPSEYVCYDNVTVSLTPQNDGTLFYSALSGGISISSVLTRTG